MILALHCLPPLWQCSRKPDWTLEPSPLAQVKQDRASAFCSRSAKLCVLALTSPTLFFNTTDPIWVRDVF